MPINILNNATLWVREDEKGQDGAVSTEAKSTASQVRHVWL